MEIIESDEFYDLNECIEYENEYYFVKSIFAESGFSNKGTNKYKYYCQDLNEKIEDVKKAFLVKFDGEYYSLKLLENMIKELKDKG